MAAIASSPLLTADTIVRGARAEYRILSLIGRGGMGAVYRATRIIDNTIWALKEMRPPDDIQPAEFEENRRMFIQEAELLRKLSHPNLPVVADLFENNGRPTLVMEFVPGKTLEDRMHDANAPLLEQDVLRYGIQAAQVLHYLHTRQPPIIYRDLKPSNIMVTAEGVMKIIDFGVARTYKERKTKDTVAMGSAGYAPPEQYGKGQTDARSDVYALGATLLHLLTALPPIPLQTPTPGSISKMNASVDRKTEQVITRAMDLDARGRYQTAAEMEQALRQCLDGPYVDPTVRAYVPPVDPPQSVAQPVTPAPVTPVTSPVASTPPVVQTQKPESVAVAGGVTCTRCGRVNKPGARFCAGCGNVLSSTAVARLRCSSPRASWEKILDTSPIRIGRRDPRQNHFPELDLAEHDRGIASRNHAIIKRNGDSYTITDQGSTNGTYLNGKRLAANAPQSLRTGDKIKVGEVEMEFRLA